jgi:PAS domain S-box-containing protein
MQTFHKRFSVVAGFVLLLAVLIGNAIVMRRQLAVQVDRQAWLLHSRLVLFQLQQVESELKDAETGQRGFLYTSDPKYLAPYRTAISQVEPDIDKLAQLTADNPHQEARIPALRSLSHAKLAELAQTISLFQSGRMDEAGELVLSDKGLFIMNDTRQLITQMNQEEDSIEHARTASYIRSVQVMSASIYLASCLAAFGLIALGWYILREMDLREKHALEIRAREEWFRTTLTSIGDAVIATDQNGKVTFLNPVAEALTGKTLASAKGADIQEVFPIFNEYTHKPADNPVRKVIDLGCVVALANHTALRHTNGTLTPIEDSAAPIRDDRNELIGVVLVFRDVTRERRSQEILRKTEKLAAAARLSATVAHEINNPLEAVVNLVYIAKAEPDAPAAVVHHLTLAEQELERVAHIARQTLGFYRDSHVPESIEVPALIESVLKLYSNKFKIKNIAVERDFGSSLPVRGLQGELKQVLSNLISNATDAVGRNGTIKVVAQCIEDAGGNAVEIVVEDDGPGIPPDHVDRIFEPFFTTKQDVGTGLGLWITKEIIDRHGGSILVRPANDGQSRGAKFTIHLPVPAESENGPSDGTSNQ